MSNRTTVRGTAMTAIGCSAPRLATAAVERPLLYDALIAITDTGWRFDEQTNAGPLCRGASRGASGGGVSHDMSVPHVISGGGTVDLPGCGRPARRRVESEGRRSGRPQPLEISRTIAAARACGSGREIPTAPQRIVVMDIDHRKRSLHDQGNLRRSART